MILKPFQLVIIMKQANVAVNVVKRDAFVLFYFITFAMSMYNDAK